MQIPDSRPLTSLTPAAPLAPSVSAPSTSTPAPVVEVRDEVAVAAAPVQRAATAPASTAPAPPPSPPRPAARPATDAVPKVLVEDAPAPPSVTTLLAPQAHAARNGGFDPSNLDPTVDPRVDFYHYAVGGWIKNNPIPEELPRWGRFLELSEKNTKILDEILQEAAAAQDAPHGSVAQKLGDFYASGMDTAAIDAAGIAPLQPELDRIDAIGDLSDLQSTVAHLQGYGVNVLFGVGSTQDYKDSTKVICEVGQGGLGLPDRDYYFRDDEKSQGIRQAYVEHVAKTFELMGEDNETAQAHAQTVMDIETKLAHHSRTRVQLRDPEANYNKLDRDGLRELTTHIDWDNYLSDIGIPDLEEMNVGQPEFFQALDEQLSSRSIDDWKTYLRWHLVDSTAGLLSAPFVDENFHFKGTVLNGTPVNRPRWKRVVAGANDALGELLGQAYVERAFPPEAKARVSEMVGNLKVALSESIGTLPWMGDATREKAIEKMDAFTEKIGYPDKWKDYSALEIDRGPYVQNVLRADRFAFDRDLAKIGKPVDPTEWHMTPSTVNAYYNPLENEIVFPAGILQPPFFDPNADDAINYGAIGAVIGHEMTHGFDDKGAQFDANGNLQNWFTEEDLAAFQQRTDAVSALYEGFEVEPGLHLNGKLVTGEATADLGGLAIAYRAFQKSMEGKPRPAVIDGFTPEQRFFLGFAQVWSGSQRPEYTRMQVQTDPHPVANFRVNGTLMNMPEFGQAFGVPHGDPMQLPPEQQIRIF